MINKCSLVKTWVITRSVGRGLWAEAKGRPRLECLQDTGTRLLRTPFIEFLSTKQLHILQKEVYFRSFQHLQPHFEKAPFPLTCLEKERQVIFEKVNGNVFLHSQGHVLSLKPECPTVNYLIPSNSTPCV